MQFHLETDELNLLANVLAEQDPRRYNELLNKVLAHDLRFDSGELEQSADLLAGKKRSLKDEIARQPDATLKMDLQRQLALLERVLERVNEACVMF
jgi:putative sterol carrier protein